MKRHSVVVVAVCLVFLFDIANLRANSNSYVDAAPPTVPPTLNVTPDQLPTSWSTVTLDWSNIANPNDTDFIAIYSPSSSITYSNGTKYIGFLLLNESSTWMSGNGSIALPLVNMRDDYVFGLWSNGGQNLTATSNTVTFENINEPLQGHLQLTNDPSVFILMWVTGENSTIPTVEMGLSSGTYEYSFTGISYTYTQDQMCAAPANETDYWRDPGFIHEVNMTGLNTTTLYFYRFGNNQTGWSPEFSFITSPGANPNVAVNIIAFGDMGIQPPFMSEQEQQQPAAKTAAWIAEDIEQLKQKGIPTAVLHIGDISYARGYAYIWEYFFSYIQPAATAAPYMVLIGNHEYDWYQQPFLPSWRPYGNDSGGECGVPYSQRFHMPNADTVGSYDQRNLWYSFNYGPIHFVFMSTEHNFTVGSDQYDWIVNDLENFDRSQTPWLIFSGHRPMYTTMEHSSEAPFENQLRDAYEPLFMKYNVDVALWGHVHAYERSCGMHYTVCADSDNDATVHVTIGMAGNTYQSGWIQDNSGHMLQPDWMIFRTINYGYTRLFANSTHFNLKLYGDQRNELHDDFWLEQ